MLKKHIWVPIGDRICVRIVRLTQTSSNQANQASAFDYRPSPHVCQRRHLRGSGDTTRSPFSSPSGLGFARFFYPLVQAVLRMGGHPAIGQQGLQSRCVAGAMAAQHPNYFVTACLRRSRHTDASKEIHRF